MDSEDQKPPTEQRREEPPTEQRREEVSSAAVIKSETTLTIATTGKRQSLRDIRRQLQEAELANPGVQKLLLEDLETAESECEVLQQYVERFHQADKQAAVLEERLRTNKALEILFGVGVGVGCLLVGSAQSLWDATSRGPIVLVLGAILIVGSTIARIVKR